MSLPDDQGVVRVIAGEFASAKGPAKTFTPIHVWDLRLTSDERTDLAVPDGYTTALLLCGEPIDEPIVGYGPFVMNSPQEIRQAIADYQSGKMGHLS